MTKIKIPYVNLKKQWISNRSNYLRIIDKELSGGNFISSKTIDVLERKLSIYCKSKFCVTLNSGTDAILLALHLLGVTKGDEVITAPNSFIATASAIHHLGAKPVYVDVDDSFNIDPHKIEKKISKKTKAILPVHLCGRLSNMKIIKNIANKYNLKIVEDAAQSVGSMLDGKLAGYYGDIATFSLHPLKNLNAFGDGGFLITNSEHIYEKCKLLRNHGLENRNNAKYFGYNSRLDSVQAAIVHFHLSQLNHVISKRRKNAMIYFNEIKRHDIILPVEKNKEYHTYHTFMIRSKFRNKLKEYLFKKGVETNIHYPILIPNQTASKNFKIKKTKINNAENLSNEILTLPINQYLTDSEIKAISNLINKF